MVTDREFVDAIHILIHSLRLVPNYKSTIAEQKVSKLVLERFEGTCKECHQVLLNHMNNQQPQSSKGVLGKLGDFVNGS